LADAVFSVLACNFDRFSDAVSLRRLNIALACLHRCFCAKMTQSIYRDKNKKKIVQKL